MRDIITLLLLFMSCASFCVGQESRANPEPFSGRKTYDYTTIELIDRFHNTLKLGKWDNLFLHNEEEFTPIYIGYIKSAIQLVYKPEKTGNISCSAPDCHYRNSYLRRHISHKNQIGLQITK